jgi:hypothetical protein
VKEGPGIRCNLDHVARLLIGNRTAIVLARTSRRDKRKRVDFSRRHQSAALRHHAQHPYHRRRWSDRATRHDRADRYTFKASGKSFNQPSGCAVDRSARSI